MSLSAEWSRQIAYELNERCGRTVSRVMADGLNSLLGDSSNVDSTKVVHALMAGAVLTGASSKASWGKVASWMAVGGLTLWIAGQASPNSDYFR